MLRQILLASALILVSAQADAGWNKRETKAASSARLDLRMRTFSSEEALQKPVLVGGQENNVGNWQRMELELDSLVCIQNHGYIPIYTE